jgi:signal transduction histidine kinase/DNA-binding response OmpR family regulator
MNELSVLIVDDRPDKLLALSTALDDICPNIVTAESGRKALKYLLEREFAVILLDVNMPGMDGFEAASLIRQRQACEHTPIIFITSYGDDMHMARGYSLGAVDYILAPVVPEVLRTKVSVFLDLYRKTREVERQAERLQARAEQLHRLTQASLAIHSATSMDAMLATITDAARELVGADQAITVMVWDDKRANCKWSLSRSDEYEARCGMQPTASGAELHALWGSLGRVRRLTAQEMAAHPAWQTVGKSLWSSPEAPDWLAAALTAGDGHEMGLIHLCHKQLGDFSEDDEAAMLQLARIASIAIENMLNSEAREANRVKDEFLATLSHELRTPLTAMLGWVQLLRSGALDTEDASRGMEIIERNVMSQARLIDDLLDVSRIITGKLRLAMRPISLVSVIEAALDVVRPTADAKGLVLESTLDPAASQVTGDPDRLQQVIWNLLVNAIKFTSREGAVHVSLAREGPHVRIEVSDTGEGIEPAFLPHIFDRFRQADSSSRRAHGGLGLGLAIVRHVTELHGGTAWATSEGPGRGATFVVRLPLTPAFVERLPTRPAALLPATTAPMTPADDFAGLRIVVIDDDPDGRDMVAQVLRMHHAEVTTAAGAREALERIAVSPPDLIISDIGMPGEDGYDLIRQVRGLPRERGGMAPALALTAFARDEDRTRALAAGFQAHASKPIGPAELVSIVAQLAGARCRGQDSAASRGQDSGASKGQDSGVGDQIGSDESAANGNGTPRQAPAFSPL